jgi:hypothetical protein
VDAARARVAAEHEQKVRKWDADKRKELQKDVSLRGKRKELEEVMKKHRKKWDEEGQRVRFLSSGRHLIEILNSCLLMRVCLQLWHGKRQRVTACRERFTFSWDVTCLGPRLLAHTIHGDGTHTTLLFFSPHDTACSAWMRRSSHCGAMCARL